MDNSTTLTPNASVSDLGRSGEDANASYVPPLAVSIPVLFIFGIIIFVGIAGNLVVLVVIASVKSMHTTVNRCLFALGLADLVVLVFLPILPILHELGMDASLIGKNLCMFLIFYDRGAIVCSVLLFFYMTLDRYLAVCYPLSMKQSWLVRRASLIIVGIWFLAGSTSVPYLYIGKYDAWTVGNVTSYYCHLPFEEPWMMWYETVSSVIIFFLPIPCLVCFYSRMILHIKHALPSGHDGDLFKHNSKVSKARKQVVIMLMLVVVIFMICQLPILIIIMFDFHLPSVFSFTPWDKRAYTLTWICRILVYVNSASNPIVYFSVSSNFREAFRTRFCCFKSTKQPSTSVPTVSSRTNGVSSETLK